MTTITFKEDVKIEKTNYDKLVDFLSFFDTDTIYEEYLERKYQEVKNSPESDFVNL